MSTFREMFRNVKEWYQGEDTDPYSVVFVVLERHDENPDITVTENVAVGTAMKALLGLFSKYGTNDELTRRIDAWTNSRIRKIVKRAHGSKWRKALKEATEGTIPAYVESNDVCEVICFAPMRTSEQTKPIKNLQVTGLDLNRVEQSENDVCNNVLNAVLEESLDMSTGKSIAQYGHAIQLAFKELSDDDFDRWSSNGYRFVCRRGSVEKTKAARNCQVEVHDAGFTEIEAGSLTVVAYFE